MDLLYSALYVLKANVNVAFLVVLLVAVTAIITTVVQAFGSDHAKQTAESAARIEASLERIETLLAGLNPDNNRDPALRAQVEVVTHELQHVLEHKGKGGV